MPPKKKRKKKRRSHYRRGEHTSTKTGATYKYRSGWEESMMRHLDGDPTVSSWTYEQTPIEYVSNIRTNRVRRYYPDFLVIYLDGRRELLEVKPKRKMQQAVVRKKASAAYDWCRANDAVYKIVTEVELKAMGLLP